MNGVLWGVLTYVLLQLMVGVLVSRNIRSESDYLIAGRRIGLGLATFSMFATWFGAESCIGAAGKFYSEGLAGGLTDPFGYALALFLIGLVFAVPLWKRNLTTLADLFRSRYSPGVERLAALIMAPTSVFWAAAQIRAFGQVLHSSSGLEVDVCVALAAAVVIIYTFTGGLLADVMTDLVQGIAIILGLSALLVILAISPEVNLAHAWRNMDSARLRIGGGHAPLALVELCLLTLCGSLVAQEVFARVLASRTHSVARSAALYGGGLYLGIGLIPAFLGLVGVGLIPDLNHPETILPRLAEDHLPTFFYIAFLGALVSAILSTVDSTLLAASALVSHNFVVSLHPAMSERRKLFLARLGVAVFGVGAYALALGAESIFELVQQANGVGSAGVFVILVFGLFTRYGRSRTAASTLVVALGTWAYGTYLGGWPYAYLTSLLAALGTYLLLGLLESRPPCASSAK